MINRQINFIWHNSRYILSNRFEDENIRYTPRQGYGVGVIVGWLVSDFHTIHSVNNWINTISGLENSRAPDDMFGMGNAYWVLAKSDYVFIGTEEAEESQVIMNKEQLLYILEQYKNFLQRNYKPNKPAPPIDVEFIAEGKKAIEFFNNLDGSQKVPYAL